MHNSRTNAVGPFKDVILERSKRGQNVKFSKKPILISYFGTKVHLSTIYEEKLKKKISTAWVKIFSV
jgi:hypothetical protein